MQLFLSPPRGPQSSTRQCPASGGQCLGLTVLASVVGGGGGRRAWHHLGKLPAEGGARLSLVGIYAHGDSSEGFSWAARWELFLSI